MKTFLLLLLPAFISAQWGESTTLPASSGECAAEIDKMVACLPNNKLLDRIERFLYANLTENLSLIDEIETILDCFGELKCDFSKLFESHLTNSLWILRQLYNKLETCVIDNGLLNQLLLECRRSITIVEGPPPVNPDSEKCDISHFISCSMKELRKHPEECSREQRKLFYKVSMALRASCLIGMKFEAELEKDGDNYAKTFFEKMLKLSNTN